MFSTLGDHYSSSFIKNSRAAVLEVTEMVIIRTPPSLRMLNLGSTAGLQAGAIIGLPPVLNFGSPELKARVVPEVFSGKKFICLAISEAFAGSDVMGLKATARKTEDGKHWIIDGTKKWITNGQCVTPLCHCRVLLKGIC
jgi:alkylation response protein AidB-like acyl-CoA dehydrogenase